MRKTYIVITLLFSLLITGCKKFVEIGLPKNQLITTAVYEHDETANSAMLGVYVSMNVNLNFTPGAIANYTGIAGDELTNNNTTLATFYNNAISPVTNTASNPLWRQAYATIYLANGVYEGCNGATLLSANLKKQLQGEALFIRAYVYFYLVNLYGDVPLLLSTDYAKNASAARTPVNTIYEQIISDLVAAQTNLSDSYVDASGLATTTVRLRPNKAAATALLARVYLYTGKYAEAESAATTVIVNAQYALETLDRTFLTSSKEAIWQLGPQTNNYLASEALAFVSLTNPVSQQKPVLSPQLLGAFENGDLRRTKWVAKVTAGGIDYYYPYKYKTITGTTSVEYSAILRLAEQYLIRAEARNQQNNTAGAIADLNFLRQRARDVASIAAPNPLPNLPATLTKDQTTAAILQERRVELFAEQGHRWLDMKRTGIIDAVMSVVTPLKGGGNTWSPNWKLWPVPQNELLNDVNLTQNPGY